MSSPTSSARAGSHRGGSSSISALVSTLVPCIVVAGFLVGAFLMLRVKLRRVYAPRTYHDALYDDEKTPSAGPSTFGWLSHFSGLSDDYVLNHHSLDAYLYMRFLKVLTLMCFVGAIVTWPILFPVNGTGGAGESGLDVLSFSNISDSNPARYFAHAVIAWVFFGWVMFLVGREMLYLVKVRRAYLLSTWNASRISQRTVLFTDVPEKSLTLEHLHSMFPQVAQVWLVPAVEELEDDVEDLEKMVSKLEASEIKLIQTVNKQRIKNGEKESSVDTDSRPKHRLKFLIGEKVDSISYYRKQVAELLPKIRSAQRSHLAGKERLVGAVFIEFETMAAAEKAFDDKQHRRPTDFSARQMGVLPDEVIWKNLGMGAKSRMIRHIAATIAISVLIAFWSIPVAIVGVISNVNYLTENVPFLGFIDSIPSVILGVVTGLLPVLLLAVLMALVPVICRFLAKLSGAATTSDVEQQCQKWYFAFQVIQVFLVTTFTSGAAAVASQIVTDPTQAVPLLSQNLPKASNFYISYFILYGVANAARYLFNLIGLLGAVVLSKFAKTPRKKYLRYIKFTEPSWGAEYPKWTNLGVIAICYAVIAPLVLGFATVGIGLIYLSYRYNMFYVHDTHIDTKGGFYARALEQLMVGVYLGELCLLGLFGLNIGNSVVSAGPTVMQGVLIVMTVVFHLFMKRKIKHSNLSFHAAKFDARDAENGQAGDQTIAPQGLRDSSRTSDQGLVSSDNDQEDRHMTYSENNQLESPSSAPLKRSPLQRVFSPHTLSVDQISASLIPRFNHPVPPYTRQDVLEAYLHPAMAQRREVIWLARDSTGLSKNEVAELLDRLGSHHVEITDEGATMNEKGKVFWDDTNVKQAPLWKSPIVY
ncbi:hypothetical protein C7974DRAFT_432319 [Boeremia exigua]|uniref:uncharacterized protein n=1 Tax=Boeremia exigua TaxID=749465 RepID=UPI001E8DEC38|nr:uncharacterized protein C7974DRAFT_432319 [Boeremia exigua]KAH6637380.1 hypothetical protein C7974DRAFT_432319 [Boeremia exigua]